ncbi:MAG: hypothetical protein RSD85_01715 [Erysipelotrichaceae bacterium]
MNTNNIKFWRGTKESYNKLKDSSKIDGSKLYFITDVNNGELYLGDKTIAKDNVIIQNEIDKLKVLIGSSELTGDITNIVDSINDITNKIKTFITNDEVQLIKTDLEKLISANTAKITTAESDINNIKTSLDLKLDTSVFNEYKTTTDASIADIINSIPDIGGINNAFKLIGKISSESDPLLNVPLQIGHAFISAMDGLLIGGSGGDSMEFGDLLVVSGYPGEGITLKNINKENYIILERNLNGAITKHPTVIENEDDSYFAIKGSDQSIAFSKEKIGDFKTNLRTSLETSLRNTFATKSSVETVIAEVGDLSTGLNTLRIKLNVADFGDENNLTDYLANLLKPINDKLDLTTGETVKGLLGNYVNQNSFNSFVGTIPDNFTNLFDYLSNIDASVDLSNYVTTSQLDNTKTEILNYLSWEQ